MVDFSMTISVTENGRKSPNWSINSDLDGERTLENLLAFSKATILTIAKQVLKEEQDRGFPKNPVVVVDGSHNKTIQEVNPLGRIDFVAPQDLGKILISIYQNLLDRSAVLTGSYKDAHVVTYNGTHVANSIEGIKGWIKSVKSFSDKDKIRFVNTQPYAGKLERHSITNEGGKALFKNPAKKSNKKSKFGVVRILKPNGTYVLAAKAAKQKYGNNVYIEFEFRPGSFLGIPRYFKSKQDYVYPTILVYIFKSGITNE